jgi:Zn finger protein HypA/HybF involved in hydrogenase expression
MGTSKRYNIINIRKKKCDQCQYVYEMFNHQSTVKCPKCGSRKVHYIHGGAVSRAGICIHAEMRMYHK